MANQIISEIDEVMGCMGRGNYDPTVGRELQLLRGGWKNVVAKGQRLLAKSGTNLPIDKAQLLRERVDARQHIIDFMKLFNSSASLSTLTEMTQAWNNIEPIVKPSSKHAVTLVSKVLDQHLASNSLRDAVNVLMGTTNDKFHASLAENDSTRVAASTGWAAKVVNKFFRPRAQSEADASLMKPCWNLLLPCATTARTWRSSTTGLRHKFMFANIMFFGLISFHCELACVQQF